MVLRRGLGPGMLPIRGCNSHREEYIWDATLIGKSTSRQNSGAGIGTGFANNQASSGVGTLTIQNGNVTGNSSATLHASGSGIGTGSAVLKPEPGNSGIGCLIIENANATGSSTSLRRGGSGIGTDNADHGNSRIGCLIIVEGNVTGRSNTTEDIGGSGIGTGSATHEGNSSVGSLTIENGMPRGAAQAGIMAGRGLALDLLILPAPIRVSRS
jgi:hypothetical protein